MSNSVKTSIVPIVELNNNKRQLLVLFCQEYDRAVRYYISYLWYNTIVSSNNIFDRSKDLLNCPQFISTVNTTIDTWLSSRALKSAATQACGIVSGAVEKRKRLLYVRNKLQTTGKRTRKINKQLLCEQPVIPNPKVIYPELNTLCSKIEKFTKVKADFVISLSCLVAKAHKTKFTLSKICIPINATKHLSKLFDNDYVLMSGMQITPDKIYLKAQKTIPEIKKTGRIVGADQGISTVLSLSDHQTTFADKHGWTLGSILNKLKNKTKGSKSFNKVLDHRDNFIRWSVNQLNFTDIKEVRLEKISNFRQGKNVGKFLNYFGETLIREKLLDVLALHGVRATEQSSAFRSQRCSQCGYVDPKNRKAKNFVCQHCRFQADADYNASCNHEQDLPSIKYSRDASKQLKQFWWKPSGLFSLDGSELAVPDTNKR